MNKLGWSAKGTTLTQKELDEYVASRPRAGEKEIIQFGNKEHKFYREITHCLCPNDTCDHTYMIECEEVDCPCCRQTCT